MKQIIAAILCMAMALGAHAQTVLAGSTKQTPDMDANTKGSAEAFYLTATASGTLGFIALDVDSLNSAKTIEVGLYSDKTSGCSYKLTHCPGTLLSYGMLYSAVAGRNNVAMSGSIQIVKGTNYWEAVWGAGGSRQKDGPISGYLAAGSSAPPAATPEQRSLSRITEKPEGSADWQI